MALKLPIGIDNFKKVIEGGYVYVDKTLMIEEVLNTSANVQLITRPRRFGKTITLSMLRYFFDQEVAGAHLFSGLAVEKRPCFQHAGMSPVIFVSFKDIKEKDHPTFLSKLRNLLSDLFTEHYSLVQHLLPHEVKRFTAILEREGDEAELQDALGWLMTLLARRHNREVYLFIDEYDTPIHTGYVNGYYEDLIQFMRGFLGKALKGNNALAKAVLTGILRVARESIFSDLNNVDVFTLLSHSFSNKFGFTQEEVDGLLALFHMEDKRESVAQWYNGYLCGGETIYNPWSILNYLDKASLGFKPHWVNTSSNDLIHEQLLRADSDVQDLLQQLLRGETVETLIHEQIVFQNLELDSQILLSFLLFSGYLTIESHFQKERRSHYRLKIPNLEVLLLYQDIFMQWMVRQIGVGKVGALLKSLMNGDFTTLNTTLGELVRATLSYYDTAADGTERVYHAFMVGMLVHLGNRYEITSNREAGLGRYDLMMRPREMDQPGIVMEFKAVKSPDQLDAALDSALEQMADRDYAAPLKLAGVRKRRDIAVAFCGKNVQVRGREVHH